MQIKEPNAKKLPIVVAILASALAIMALACVSEFTGPTETRQDSFSVDSSPKVVVNSTNGRIILNVGGNNVIDVTAEIRKPEQLDYQLVQDGYTITILAESRQGRFDFAEGPGADITITAPANTSIDLRASNGRIEVNGIRGSGSIRTSNGKITLVNVSGEYEARTSNGSIEFTGEMTPGSNNELRTSNGSITVNFSGEPNVHIDASTSNGKVSSTYPITATMTDGDHLIGKIGNGDAELIVRTSNGSVTFQ